MTPADYSWRPDLTEHAVGPPAIEFTEREKIIGTAILRDGNVPEWADQREVEAYVLKLEAWRSSVVVRGRVHG